MGSTGMGLSATTENTILVCDARSLQMWRRQVRRVTGNRDIPAVVFALPQLPSGRNRSLSILATEYRTACGCTAGGLVMSLAVVTALSIYFWRGGGIGDIRINHLASFVALTAGAAFCGKLLGLLWARWRLLRLGATVHALLTSA
jgi:hypothetical protein